MFLEGIYVWKFILNLPARQFSEPMMVREFCFPHIYLFSCTCQYWGFIYLKALQSLSETLQDETKNVYKNNILVFD